MEIILSICVVTMNRASQLNEALESCLACELPKETEFIIVDNASTDQTEQVVTELFQAHQYSYIYEKLDKNLGCGGGRNYAFTQAKGKYIYALDDDAIIDTKKNRLFFEEAIAILNKYHDIVSLTTQIYDTAWKANRLSGNKIKYAENLYKLKMFCGGSHFLRKDFFSFPPYFNNKYGFEEILPSLQIADKGMINAFAPDLKIIHKPLIDKWNKKDKANESILINECVVQYTLKKMFYPIIFMPLIWFAYHRRCKKYLNDVENLRSKARKVICETMEANLVQYKIKTKTVIQMYKDFGISIFNRRR